MKKIYILDSTLRDGAQGDGISFSVQDKIAVTKALDELGIDFIEAGNPGSNPKDAEFFSIKDDLKLSHSKLVAFGSTRRKNIKAEDDNNLIALLSAKTEYVAVFGKCWKLHVKEILSTTEEENFNMIYDTCKFLTDNGKHVFFDAEHFFDGYKDDKEFALKALEMAVKGGAEYVVLCDTNGGTFPQEIYDITKEVSKLYPDMVGIHTHNDRGMAVANSIMAVEAGATHIQGTYLGFGERCGNANLSTVIPNLQIGMGYNCIESKNLNLVTETAQSISEISNISIKKNEPYVGRSAFAHKAGMHADAVLKLSESFEHIDPERVGNERKFLTSEVSGRGAIIKKIHKVDKTITKDSPETAKILETLKDLEQKGYQFEGADGSFDLLIRKALGIYKPFFNLKNYKIISGRPCEENLNATATVKISVDGKDKFMAAEGNGPVNALDKALRSALESFYPVLKKMRLIDYKVRVTDTKQTTAAVVRILITSTDGKNVWTTVGVSSDVVEASLQALTESIEYKLSREA